MSAKRLCVTSVEKVGRFSVIGMYPADNGTFFVQHVAVLHSDTDLNYGMKNVRVWQMGPPLVAGPQSAAAATQEDLVCTAHLVGVVGLDAQDIEGIETWLADVDKENRPARKSSQYMVHPPVFWVEAENKSRLYRKFSCAGFVLDCYSSIGIHLLENLEAGSFPNIDLETIAEVYGDDVRRERLRAKLGIPGDGPWRVVLAGYVIHALNRPDADIRTAAHQPSSESERHFPLPPAPPGTA